MLFVWLLTAAASSPTNVEIKKRGEESVSVLCLFVPLPMESFVLLLKQQGRL